MEQPVKKDAPFRITSWPQVAMLLACCVFLLFLANAATRSTMKAFLKSFGISVRRIPRVIKELKRKGFHFSGLLIPAIYLTGLKYTTWFNREVAFWVLFVISMGYFIVECVRLFSKKGGEYLNEKFKGVMREKEKTRFTGSFFYLVGSTVSVYFFSPPVAISAILFLIIGDFMAALVGISYGRIKIGKKSLEGSVACFVSCFIICFSLFWGIKYGEQLAFWGALAATLTELLNPSFIDDNLSIPCISGLAIHLIAIRLNIPLPDGV